MQVRETDRVEDTTAGSDSYSAGWRYYTELEFDLGAGRVAVAEVEHDGNNPGAPQIVTIRGVFEVSTHAPLCGLYDAPEAADIIASLQERGLTRIRVWTGDYFSQFDATRLKAAP